MKFYIGKQVSGPKNMIPNVFMWGGTLFINWYTRSLMIPLSDGLIHFLILLGFDPIGD